MQCYRTTLNSCSEILSLAKMTMMKKRSVASEGMTATPDQSLCSSSQKSAREVIGQITEWLPLVQFEEEIAMYTCPPPPATLLHCITTRAVAGRMMQHAAPLQQCQMEDKKPNELEEYDEFMGDTEEKMSQSLFREMEEQEKSYLDIKNPSSRQPPGAQCGVMRAAATHTTSQAKLT